MWRNEFIEGNEPKMRYASWGKIPMESPFEREAESFATLSS